MSEAAGPQLRSAAEAILIVADEPVTTSAIAEALGMEDSVCEELLENLAAEYRGEAPGSRAHGFLLRRAAGGWRFASVPEHADLVEQFIIGGATARLSQAASETLAVVAYRQPVTRGTRRPDPRGQCRRRHANPARPRPHRGGRCRDLRCDSVPDHGRLPGVPGNRLPGRAATPGSLPPRVEALGEIVEQADEMAGRRTP